MELPALLFMALWFGMQLFNGLKIIQAPMEGVAWWAHVGGFVAGAALMRIFCSIVPDTDHKTDGPLPDSSPPETTWPRRMDDRGW